MTHWEDQQMDVLYESDLFCDDHMKDALDDCFGGPAWVDMADCVEADLPWHEWEHYEEQLGWIYAQLSGPHRDNERCVLCRGMEAGKCVDWPCVPDCYRRKVKEYKAVHGEYALAGPVHYNLFIASLADNLH